MERTRTGSEYHAGPDDAGRRLDRVLRILLKGASLSEIYAALRKGRIRVNGSKASPESRLAEGDRILIAHSLAPNFEAPVARETEDLAGIADVLILATRDLIFVNKPRGALSHGEEGLEPRIRATLASRSSSSLSFVPGPLHRLDRNTTGVLTYPRTLAGAQFFTSLLRERGIVKRYLALVDGELAEPAEWRDKIIRFEESHTSAVSEDGREAHASMLPLLVYGGRSLLLVELHTGLTHQIRVQASARGYPLSGDRKYGGEHFGEGYILHAVSLDFPPTTLLDLPPRVAAPLPKDAEARLAGLFGEAGLRSAMTQALEA